MNLRSKKTQTFNIRRLVGALSGFLAIAASISCTEEKSKPQINEHIASPIDIAVSDAEDSKRHFFVLNANFNNTYASGSILMLSRDGSRKKAFPISRLGRSIKVSGKRLLVTYDENKGEHQDSKVELYELSYSDNNEFPDLNLKKTWDFDNCRALNAVAELESKHFAVSCESGALLAGQFDDNDLSQSSLVKIREFPNYVRRALYLNTKKNILFAFTTEMDAPTDHDRYLKDKVTWDSDTAESINGENDVPDIYEKDLKQRRIIADSGHPFQFVTIDLNDEENYESGILKFRKHTEVRHELHWMHFKLLDKEGELETPTISSQENHDDYKYYRSNFWHAAPDVSDSSGLSFFLSHRGGENSPHSNNLIHLKLNDQTDVKTNTTDELFTVTRTYGHPEQKTSNDYLGQFAITEISSKKILVLNQFRSRKDFGKAYFSLLAIEADAVAASHGGPSFSQNEAFAKLSSEKARDGAYYQFAISEAKTDDGNDDIAILVSSFYQDSVKLYKLSKENQFEQQGPDFK